MHLITMGVMLADSAILLAADVLLPIYPLHYRQLQKRVLARDQQPWTLPGLWSELLITSMAEAAHSTQHDPLLLPSARQFFFLLFLYLVRRQSWVLATSHLNIVTRDDQISLWWP